MISKIEQRKNELMLQRKNLEYYMSICHSKHIKQTTERINCIIDELQQLELLEKEDKSE